MYVTSVRVLAALAVKHGLLRFDRGIARLRLTRCAVARLDPAVCVMYDKDVLRHGMHAAGVYMYV